MFHGFTLSCFAFQFAIVDLHSALQVDFKPVLLELVATHPGLEFLHGTPEFQERYGMHFYTAEHKAILIVFLYVPFEGTFLIFLFYTVVA